MRLRTLYAKLAAVLLALLCTLGLLYGAFTLYASKVFLQELNQRFNRDLARQLLVQQELGSAELLDEQQVKAIFSYYMHINPAIEIYLLDHAGNILAFEAPQMKIKRRLVDVEPIRRFLRSSDHYPILGDDPRDSHRQKVFSAAAYPPHGEPRQYLYVVLGGEDYDNMAALLHDSYFLQLSIAAVAVSVLFGLLAGLYAFNLLTRRLHRLTGLMGRFRASDFRRHEPYSDAASPDVRHGDEIDQLGITFDAMAQTIIAQVERLEQKDSLRRNLVANVSHDLRTPLASLQGYLETLLLKTDLDETQRRHYLEIAFQHGARLSRLVSELFELSKLEANEAQPQREAVALGELVQDAVQHFELRARQQDITLQAASGAELPFVSADIAMLNRVLENLIGNALQHTPAGGVIGLDMTEQPEGVEVCVGNSGAGITAEDLPHVWERFYQAPERRHGGGAGLGLAIVKRIIELHDGALRVSSTPGEMTRFCFTLPRWQRTADK
ncbi:MAG: ATP-binding protein [Pseudomonadota bacterium]